MTFWFILFIASLHILQIIGPNQPQGHTAYFTIILWYGLCSFEIPSVRVVIINLPISTEFLLEYQLKFGCYLGVEINTVHSGLVSSFAVRQEIVRLLFCSKLALPRVQGMSSIQHFSYSRLAAGAICQNAKRSKIWPWTGDNSSVQGYSILFLGCLWCSEPFSTRRSCLWGTSLLKTPVAEATRWQDP